MPERISESVGFGEPFPSPGALLWLVYEYHPRHGVWTLVGVPSYNPAPARSTAEHLRRTTHRPIRVVRLAVDEVIDVEVDGRGI